MFRVSKKAISEITSFVLLTLVIIIASLSVYFFSQDQINENMITFDSNNMENFLIKFSKEFSNQIRYDGSAKTYNLNFQKGALEFNQSQIIYYSLLPYFSNESLCSNLVCKSSWKGSEQLSYVLDGGYEFSENLTLVPGNYLITLEVDRKNKNVEIRLQ